MKLSKKLTSIVAAGIAGVVLSGCATNDFAGQWMRDASSPFTRNPNYQQAPQNNTQQNQPNSDYAGQWIRDITSPFTRNPNYTK